MRGKLGPVEMLEAGDEHELFVVLGLGAPEVLVDKGEVLLNRGREVIVALVEVRHSFAVKIVHLVHDDLQPLLQVTLILALLPVQLPVELHHRPVPLRVRASRPVPHQLQNAVLHQHHCDILLSDAVFPEVREVGVYAIERGLDGVLGLVVHADADEALDALEVVSTGLGGLAGEFAQDVH